MFKTEAETLMQPWIVKYGALAIAEARLKFNELGPGAVRHAWMVERFGREANELEIALHCTT